MPTPFTHIQDAGQLLENSSLEPSIKSLIQDNYPAFYLGNVAPDFQTICDIPRADTHFYNLPPDLSRQPHETMMGQYPLLKNAVRLSCEQAVFVAGYCAHLMLDMVWYLDVLIPYFVESHEWGDHHERFVAHHTLLTYLDKLAVDSFSKEVAKTLALANPSGWLPFAEDADLAQWRDALVEQLLPGAPLQTVNIYAGRLYMSATEFAANLNAADWMENNLFSRVPVSDVQLRLAEANSISAEWISKFLAEVDE